MMRFHCLILALLFPIVVSADPPNYEDDVLPIFKQHCNGCHNPDKRKADLDLTSYASVLKGGSGGEVVKAGVPDTSWLYESIVHAEGVEAMPPKKPKLPDQQIEVVHKWIAGGLLEAKGGKSKLRSISFNLTAGSMTRPEDPALPVNLPEVPLAETRVAPPIVAMAGSPWAKLVAASGHEQILLYGEKPAANSEEHFEPVAKEALVTRLEFEDEPNEGKNGSGWFPQQDLLLEEVSNNLLVKNGAFSFTAWIKPEAEIQSPTIFGRYSFGIFLEKTGGGHRCRVVTRSGDNKIAYFGRVGEIPAGTWQHLAVTCDGNEWAFFYGGNEVVRQKIPNDHVGFLEDKRQFHLGGNGAHEERQYRGGLDDVRIYSRALTPDEVAQINQNVSPTMAHIGTLPFPEGEVHGLRFSRNGELLLACGGVGAYSGKVALYEVRTGKRIASIGDEQDIVLSADISSDHQHVAIGTPFRIVKIYSVKTGELLHRIEKHTEWVTAVRFSPDGKQLATGDRNGGIHIWEADTGGIVYTLDEHKEKVTALSWRPDGQVLASAGEDGKFVLWDMKDGWATRTATVHAEKSENRYTRCTGILDIEFLRDGRFATIGRDRTIKIWQTDGTMIHQNSLDHLPLSLAIQSSAKQLYIGNLKGELEIRDLESLARIK